GGADRVQNHLVDAGLAQPIDDIIDALARVGDAKVPTRRGQTDIKVRFASIDAGTSRRHGRCPVLYAGSPCAASLATVRNKTTRPVPGRVTTSRANNPHRTPESNAIC